MLNDQLSNDQLINVATEFYHVRHFIDKVGWKSPKERYENHCLILVCAGKCTIIENDQKYELTKYYLHYHKPYELRQIICSSTELVEYYTIDFKCVLPVLQDGRWEMMDMVLPLKPCQKINDMYLFNRLQKLFNDCSNHWLSDMPNDRIRLKASFLEILNLLISWQANKKFQYDKIRKIERIIEYMIENYSSDITIKMEDLGAKVNISTQYLRKIFKEVTGRSPIEYLTNIKVEKAKDFLKKGVSVTETARLCGFNDVYYFSKCFKKVTGLSPKNFQKR
ncbi:MAG: helix-turn-helix transcriptional regulator [Firmicutes bacterium]|nr:helix-turn-helix transcriptional regulator [Bacillota bacterium]